MWISSHWRCPGPEVIAIASTSMLVPSGVVVERRSTRRAEVLGAERTSAGASRKP